MPYNISGTKEQLTEIARKIRPELVTLEDWQKRQQEENAGKTFISPDMYEQAKIFTQHCKTILMQQGYSTTRIANLKSAISGLMKKPGWKSGSVLISKSGCHTKAFAPT